MSSRTSSRPRTSSRTPPLPFAKLFEKCLLDQLNNYFVSNNLISPNQYGFKKNCSTNEAVLDIYNKLLDNKLWIKSSLHVLFS